MKTHQGQNVKIRVYREGVFWRWKITADRGVVYMDGGNYRTRAEACKGLIDALDK